MIDLPEEVHLVLGERLRVVVEPPPLPVLQVTPPVAEPGVTLVPVAGPPGPPGPPGSNAVNWYAGDGPPPNFIPGARPGDMYVDEAGGGLWQL